MNFSFINKISSKINKIELPGVEAQILLAPKFRQIYLMQEIDNKNVKKAGVLILFYPDSHHQINFVLILRKSYKGVHSGQVALPGGKVEPNDKNLVYTALREAEEEIGVKAKDIQVLKKLTKLYIPPSNFLVQPTIGVIKYQPDFSMQYSEVEDIIPVNLDFFLKHDLVKKTMISTSYTGKKQVLCYDINGYKVWGATAMILSEMQVLLKNSLSI